MREMYRGLRARGKAKRHVRTTIAPMSREALLAPSNLGAAARAFSSCPRTLFLVFF